MRINNHIKSAVGALSQHKQLSHDSLVTSDFGQIVPCLSIPLLPRDKFKIRASCFSRVSPLIFPTYGSCEVVTNFHSVQYSKVWRDFDLFVTGSKFRGTTRIFLPVLSHKVLMDLFYLPEYSYSGGATKQSHDLAIKNADNVFEYRYLTLHGRYVRKLLSGLGYVFLTGGGVSLSDSDDHVYNALPLLSFLKIYVDFYESRQYTSNSLLSEILRQVNLTSSSSYFTMDTLNQRRFIDFSALDIIFSNIRLLYPSDYFTSAQAFPSMVGDGQGLVIPSDTSTGSPFVLSQSLQQTKDYTEFQSFVSDDFVVQSNPLHRLLDNFENLVRRYNLVGSREVDRIRALFGIRPSVQRNQYSTFHGGFSSPLKIQDITSTSANPSVDNYLGSYAGKGIVSNGDYIDIESDDFGILFAFSFMKVRPLYSPGFDREVLKLSPTAYYNPDFDHGYAMAVALGEVQTTSYSDLSVSNLFGSFGFQNAYDEYRQKVSRINGDFVDSDLLPWSFARKTISEDGVLVAQSNDLIYTASPYDQPIHMNGSTRDYNYMYNEFQRIFVDQSGRDHFYLYYGFDIDALRPVRTSSESFDLGVGNVSTSNNPVI